MDDITAAILAGGLGTRLRSVVDRPKVLAPVRGRPFVTYLLDQLADAGTAEVVLLTGHRGELVEAALGASYRGMRLRYSREPAPLGTGGAVRHALPLLRREWVVLLNGDSYCDVDPGRLARPEGDIGMVLARVADTGRYGRVVVGDGGLVERFEEKAAAGGPGWINAGVYLLRREAVATWPGDKPLSLERDVLPGLVAAGRVVGQPCVGKFLDIGTPESFAEGERFFAPTAARYSPARSGGGRGDP